jgi:hypothetical protein
MSLKTFLNKDVPLNKDLIIVMLSVLLALLVGIMIGFSAAHEGREGRGEWQHEARSFGMMRGQVPVPMMNTRYNATPTDVETREVLNSSASSSPTPSVETPTAQ